MPSFPSGQEYSARIAAGSVTIRLGTNIQSVQAQRRLGEAAERTGEVFQRLASGQRITSASDDAAGLAIADALASKTRVFTQGVRNLNDGMSALTIADSAVETLIEIATRIKELAAQGASGTYSHRQRAALDKEAQLLRDEFTRIVQSTSFNGRRLLNGDVQGLAIQAGYGSDGAVVSSLGGKTGTGSFGAAQNTGVGTTPLSVSTGDFNGDGVEDIVTANYNSGNVSVLLGNGNGTFQGQSTFGVGANPFSVSTGDFNGDGVQDIVAANSNSSNVSVLLGNGNGTFQSQSTFGVGDSSYSVSTGDFNGDGVQDIVTANEGSGNVSVLLGNGNGTFQSQLTLEVGGNPYSVSTGDFNGDGVQDIVAANSSNNVSVLSGVTRDGIQPLLPFSLKTLGGSREALGIISKKLELLSAQRGQIGAFQSRLFTATQVLATQREEFAAADSRIRDADIGAETAELARSRILQQSASAIMAQANQQPALALQLLRG